MTPREVDLLRAPAALSECTGEQVPRVSTHPAKPTGLATEAQYCSLRFGSAVRSSGMRGCPTRSPSRTASMFRPASARTGDAPATGPFEACAIAVKAPPSPLASRGSSVARACQCRFRAPFRFSGAKRAICWLAGAGPMELQRHYGAPVTSVSIASADCQQARRARQ